MTTAKHTKYDTQYSACNTGEKRGRYTGRIKKTEQI